MKLRDAAAQAWPPFVLVAGLLLVGLAANVDGLFVRAGAWLERTPGPPASLLIAGMALVAVVTAILNLDTAVVFLTPVLIHTARTRGISEEPFLFGCLFMANASSLYLPGSNLTNLLVLAHERIPGSSYAAQMLAPGLVATLLTAAGLLVVFRDQLREPTTTRPASASTGIPPAGLGVGAAATLAAAFVTVSFTNPALAVLTVGVVACIVQILRRRVSLAQATKAIGPVALGALFSLSLALGVLARSWGDPAALLDHAGRIGSTAIGALAAITVNNLPAAVLLSARAPAHPRALLFGLNLGPNLAVTGSLAAYLWLRSARQLGLRPSVLAFSRRGLVLAPLAMAGALAAAALLTHAQ